MNVQKRKKNVVILIRSLISIANRSAAPGSVYAMLSLGPMLCQKKYRGNYIYNYIYIHIFFRFLSHLNGKNDEFPGAFVPRCCMQKLHQSNYVLSGWRRWGHRLFNPLHCSFPLSTMFSGRRHPGYGQNMHIFYYTLLCVAVNAIGT